MRNVAVLAALCVLVTASAQAQNVAVYGVGTKQCGVYLSDRQKTDQSFDSPTAAYYAEWFYGYLSGYNSNNGGKQITATFPRATVIAFIDKYCRDKPLGGVVGAADCLLANYGGPSYPHCK